MANANTPFGLRPVNSQGQFYCGRVRPYNIQSDYGTALFLGDPVVKTGESNTTEVEGFPVGSLPAINKAAAGDGNAITGVIVGFSPLRTDLSKQYNPASTARVAYVLDDPTQVFEIQADGAIPAASIGLNAVLIYTVAGSTYSGLSGVQLDTTSDVPAADASNQLTIVQAVMRPDNDTTLAYAKVLVRINNHTEAPGAIGI